MIEDRHCFADYTLRYYLTADGKLYVQGLVEEEERAYYLYDSVFRKDNFRPAGVPYTLSASRMQQLAEDLAAAMVSRALPYRAGFDLYIPRPVPFPPSIE
jgi:hypothetical protein